MKRTKLRIASVAAGVVLLVGGLASSPASADKRRVIVTVQGGKTYTLTLDPGAPIPDLGAPVVSVVEAGTIPDPVVTTTTPPPVTGTATAPSTTLTTPSTPVIPPASPTTPSTGTTPPTTGSTGTTPGVTGTTPGTTGTTGTTGTGTTGTTRTTPPVVGGIVKPKGRRKGEGSAVAVPRNPPDDGAELQDQNPAAGTPEDSAPAAPADSGVQPTPQTPGYTVAPTLDAPTGVPNFFIEQFRIPPFLLPIYQAAGMQYGVPWQVLAAINEIETDYGRNLSVSTAGALGWMQFMPSTWETYGVDANGDGVKDPYNPVDAIFAAARYLKAAGAETNLEQAIFAYNHADWYVQSVLLRARVIGGMPADIVGSLTGLTQGRFPVAARATYADSLDERSATRRQQAGGNAAVTVEGDPTRRSINIYSRSGAPVVAVNDGRIVKLGENEQLGRFVVLEDVYGNRFTYSHLGSIADKHPVPKPHDADEQAPADLALPRADPRPTQAATDDARPAANAQGDKPAAGDDAGRHRAPASRRPADDDAQQQPAQLQKERLFANPGRPLAYRAGGERQIASMGEQLTTFDGYFTGTLQLDPADYVLKPLRRGSSVIAGTVLGRIARTDDKLAPHVEFAIRPAGRGAPQIDPKPILDGWKLLESTAIYKSANASAFGADGRGGPSIGQIFLMSKEELQARVLADPNVEIYQCGRDDIRSGQIDRRVLATIEFLVASGLKPTITNLKCGHSYLTTSGNVSEHTTGTAMDIGAINGITITPATQGEGSITDITVRRLLTLQGAMKPHQIITLMTYPGTDNTLALPDHDDHIHVGFHPAGESTGGYATPRLQTLLRPEQWTKLVDQLRTIQNPIVPTSPSRYAVRDGRAGSGD